MEYRTTSFLKELVPDTYQFLKSLRPIALLYAVVLCIMVVLSLFLQCGFIKFFIDCMMGWTLLSIPFVGVIIVVFDKEFKVEDILSKTKFHHKEMPYKFSMVWGIVLCVAGLVALYYSNRYKKYYAFQCQDFYLEETTGVYHILKDCEYIGINKDDTLVDNPSIVRLSGRDLLNTNYEFCEACHEWAEEAESEVASYQYRRP